MRLKLILGESDGRSYLGVDLRESAHSVLVFIRFCEETEIEVSMLSGHTPLAGLTVSGRSGELASVSV
jgi:hypothetical protein